MNKDMRLLRILLYLALLLIGIVIGIAIRHYYNLPLSESLNIIDLATLVTTIFLAVYIPEVLDRRLQVKRDKKDLIEKRIDELQAIYRRINLTIQGEEPIRTKDILMIKNYLDVADHKTETLITLLTYANLHMSFTNEINELNSLVDEHRELLWSEHMEEEGFSYPDDVQAKEEVLYNRIDKMTSLLVFRISEA